PLSPVGDDQQPPTHYGVLLFRAFELLDVYGPLDILQFLAHNRFLTLKILARTLDPVTTEPASAGMNTFKSDFWPSLTPTHTFEQDPDIEVLIVPGGPGARSPDLEPELEYIRTVFPKLRYLITICTGSGVAARSGVLDGHKATTNKRAWGQMTAYGPNVNWVAPARWVDDGKVWTSSGVTAGMDLIFQFIKDKYPAEGQNVTQLFSDAGEFTPITDSTYDPWAYKYNITSLAPQ
ncbi:class I glutamine amidotransferase-like protein, partial [Podospora australis]